LVASAWVDERRNALFLYQATFCFYFGKAIQTKANLLLLGKKLSRQVPYCIQDEVHILEQWFVREVNRRG
jgi:hypothetical protein